MTARTSTFPLHLHLVPAGRRLDFTIKAGSFAYVYRRQANQEWKCVARNACSPFLDTSVLEPEAAPEYVIRYRDASGATLGVTSVVQAHPVGFPARPNWVSLR
ncbi:hypothetical protein MUN84_03175 [Hymenobacter sp. 5516J-16]|uniref:hypothetical protein n=1 Tax=Hymenobacter sp. 5516J-16 TaxID=2932253 RepID=UPI001FD59780|nr:hypothetical protein [Hymenobacter sp. 5516J-16]UOQ77691.1 hypothetical protein MUN84_03175 [Hymenobacter sp. 5516J-16]